MVCVGRFPYFENLSTFRRHPAAVVNRSGIFASRQTSGVELVQGADDARDSNPRRTVRRVIADNQNAVGFAVVWVVHLRVIYI